MGPELAPLVPVAKDCSTKSHAPRFEELDALRGCCICFIISGHFWFAFGHDRPILGLVNTSLMAVDVLFVMSGYVIAYAYLMDGKLESLLSSAFRRFPRLLLPALVANLLSWLLKEGGAFNSYYEWRSLNGNSTWCITCMGLNSNPDLTPKWAATEALYLMFSFGGGPWTFPWQWTIPCEVYGSMIVFMLAPLCRFVVTYRTEGMWDVQLKRIALLHGACCLILFCVTMLMAYAIQSMGIPNQDGSPNEILDALATQLTGKSRTAFLFVAGMALAQASIALQNAPVSSSAWTDRLREEWCRHSSTKWAAPVCFLCLALSFPLIMACIDDNIGGIPQPPYWGVVVRPFMNTAGPVFILLGVLCAPKECRASFGSSPFIFLGKICFSLYLLQFIVIFAVGMPLNNWLMTSHLTASHFGVLGRLALVWLASIGPLIVSAYAFWLTVEDPVGMRLPRKVFPHLWNAAIHLPVRQTFDKFAGIQKTVKSAGL